MRMTIDVAMHYRVAEPTTAFLAIEAARTEGQVVLSETLDLGTAQPSRIAGDSGVGERLWLQLPGDDLRITYRAEVEVNRQVAGLGQLAAVPLHRIPGDVAPYLRPSRYCQSDKFVTFVGRQFAGREGGAKVAAIRDWIERELSYVPGSSDADTNVLETFAGRQGVCRDYAHLMCSMVRAASIPARMVAAYGPDVTPQDFHAVAQVWLEDGWHLVDATGMCAADGLAVIAVGRDAYDIAFLDTWAPVELVSQEVYARRT
ncbi:transglutaminase-like domain-containing protein [Sagittula salina]|uniref:Transglutaminase family protein n=1 Tax=Sagittula salina TaxID=2820268 RepID=A0A940RZW5_9RHOB|nr:transglutaminase family protein [Sagittula salina]MBP0481427.1 transglutaminase family protein [Sagittula salina]